MNNKLSYKKISNVVICLSVVGLVMAVVGTYSYFSKSGSYNVTGTVVNWSFSADNSTENFTKTLNDIVPGDSGSFSISLDATNSTSDVECSVIPNISNEIQGMKFYTNEEHTTEISTENPLKVNVTSGTSSSVTIYWVWEYDTGLLSSSDISFSMDVVGRQITS